MTALKVIREHGGDIGLLEEHGWQIDRQRPVELLDNIGRRSWEGGTPHVSLRCKAPRGCTARAYVVEAELLALFVDDEQVIELRDAATTEVVEVRAAPKRAPRKKAAVKP